MPASGNTSKISVIFGWIIGILPAFALAMSACMKLTKAPAVLKGFPEFGWPVHLLTPLGLVELSCAIIYLIPRTAALGAILMTGFLGGAIATHVRLEQPFYIQAGLGVLVWLGLYFRDPRVRSLIPIRV